MSYTLKQASDATGRDKSTIQRAIKNGRISANVNDKGTYQIDPAELHRVFEPVACNTEDSVALQQDATGVQPQENAVVDEIVSENRELKARVELLREMVTDLRRLLDDECSERRKLTALLTYQPPVAPLENATQQPKTRPWIWVWLATTTVALATVVWLLVRQNGALG